MQNRPASVVYSLCCALSVLARGTAPLNSQAQRRDIRGSACTLAIATLMAIAGLVAPPAFGQSCTDPQNPARSQECIWSNSSVPTTVDDGGTTAIEVGVKFTADVSGYILGIRFYKASSNTGTHIGNVWTTGGTLLATATFAGETASGWQQVDFATPVAVSANTTYIASYHSNTGHTSDDHSYFTNSAFNDPPLHALQSLAGAGNGVYVYNAGSAFPTVTNLDSNYWVDVAYVPTFGVFPANATIALGSTQQFAATQTNSDGSTQDLTGTATWSSSNTGAATISGTGLATGVAGGTATIQATSGSLNSSTTLTVSATGLMGYWKFDDGSGSTAADSSGNSHAATLVNGISWVTGEVGGAISANGTNQYATIPAINLSSTSTVTVAFWANRTYSTTVESVMLENSTNYNNSTTGFGFFPDDTQCKGIQAAVHGNVGYSVNCYHQPSSGVWHHLTIIYDKTQAGTQQTALYIDGVLQTPTSNYSTAKNTNSFGSNATYLFSRAGSQYFNGGKIDDLRVYSRALTASEIQQLYQSGSAPLVSMAVTPANGSIGTGGTQQYVATGTYSDGSTQNLTSTVTWSSTNTGVATITSGGLATGVATGSSTITATSGSISGSTGLTVTAATLATIAVTPANTSIISGGTQQYVATGTYSDGSTQNLTSTAAWSSTNTGVATIASGGLATGVGTGGTTITATSGSIHGNTSLTVTAGAGQGFAYRRAITLTNSGSSVTNYQVKISLTSSNMNFSHAKPDGSDIQVRASDGVTSLQYWIENWNSASQTATVWTNVPSLPSGTSTIYLVYGSASAVSSASGANTFPFFDDFSSADSNTLNGYYQESPLATVNMGAAQGWEGSDQPHFFTVLANPYGATLDGVNYKYWAWYGLHDHLTTGIGLAGSNDLVNWTKYSGNPVIPMSTGASRPSVILDGTTLRMAYETTASIQQIGYATSTNGISWTIRTPFTSNPNGAYTPHLWVNPNDSKFYLYYSSGPADGTNIDTWPVYGRSAATADALTAASDTVVWNAPASSVYYQVYAPHMTYDAASGLYVLQIEAQPNVPSAGDTNWDVTTLLSTSPTSGFYLAAGNPYHSGGTACPENYTFSGTIYTYYCHYTGSSWVIQYTTASVSAGLQKYGKPKTSLWTDVHDTADQAPVWYLQPCTDWKGSSSNCLVGFGRYTGANGISPMLQSSYSGANYSLNGQIYGMESDDALFGFRMGSTPGDEYTAEIYYNYSGSTNFYIANRAPGQWSAVSSVAAGATAYNTWYQVEADTSGTAQASSIENNAYSTKGTDATYTSGRAGPSLEQYGASMFGYVFIHQYASPAPSNSVGSETSGNY